MTTAAIAATPIRKGAILKASLLNGAVLDLIFPASCEHYTVQMTPEVRRFVGAGGRGLGAGLVTALVAFCRDEDNVDTLIRFYGAEAH